VKKSERIEDFKDDLGRDAYLSVVAVVLAKAVFIGSIDSVATSADGITNIIFSRNHGAEQNRGYHDQEKAVLKVEFLDFRMTFSLKEVAPNKTNVCLVGIVTPNIPIPQWLFRITAHLIFPNLLSDYDEWMKRREQLPKQK